MAVAGILLGAYSISSKPLPENFVAEAAASSGEHSFTMLPALGTMAAILVGVQALHAGIRAVLGTMGGNSTLLLLASSHERKAHVL
jgi:hypothetical protein